MFKMWEVGGQTGTSGRDLFTRQTISVTRVSQESEENPFKREDATTDLPFFELAFVLVRLDHVASFIVNANHGIVWPAVNFAWPITEHCLPAFAAHKHTTQRIATRYRSHAPVFADE
jgi:hypothetical protein